MRYFLIFTILFFVFSPIFAQENNPNELEVKTSGDYIWEQLSGTNEAEIKIVLANAIWKKGETQELLKSNPNLDKSAIDYIVKPRGNNFLIVAYLAKNPVLKNKEVDNKKSGNDRIIKPHEKLESPNTSIQNNKETTQLSAPNELEVKTSGDYIWEQLSGTNEAELKVILANAIWKKVETQELLKNQPNIDKSAIGYIAKPRGNNYLMVAYLSKNPSLSKLAAVENQSEEMHKQQTDSKKIETASPMLERNQQKVDKTHNSQTQKEESTREINIPNESSTNKSTSETDDQSVEFREVNNVKVKKAEVTEDKQNKDNNTQKNSETSIHSAFVSKILKQSKCVDIVSFLEQEKRKGTVFYNTQKESFDKGIETCYIMVCDTQTGNLVYFLSPGGKNRKDLMVGKNISLLEIESKSNLKSLYIYEIN